MSSWFVVLMDPPAGSTIPAGPSEDRVAMLCSKPDQLPRAAF